VAFDPQTSGGLLIAVAAKAAARLMARLHAKGIGAAAIVGRACARRDAWVYLE
jgi:selenide,water dikinase